MDRLLVAGEWIFSQSIYKSSVSTDVIMILTESEKFKKIDWELIFRDVLKPSCLFDTRNIADHKSVLSNGIKFWRIGNNIL